MDGQEIVDLCLKHTMYSWSATGAVQPLPIVRAEGIYMYTAAGQRILDFNSQLMSVLIGHAHPKVIAAMKHQLDELIFVYPTSSSTPSEAPRRTRTPFAPPRRSPAGRRSCRAIGATTAAPTRRCSSPAIRAAGRTNPGCLGSCG